MDPETRSARVTSLASAAARDDRRAAEELLPLLYQELRSLARHLMVRIPPGDTLQPTALVHEAYLRLVADRDPGWDGRPHFFGAAARAMRQILVDRARHKASKKAGGGLSRVDVDDFPVAVHPPHHDVLALDEALRVLERADPRAARVATLRYFAGLRTGEIASLLSVSAATVLRDWRLARSFLAAAMTDRNPLESR